MTIDVHTHVLPERWPDLVERWGDGRWPRLERLGACSARILVTGSLDRFLQFDAQVVALCREAGVTALLTEDRDFDRFRGFRTLRL